MTTLKPGLYTLTRDVENPRPDRRQRGDWRALPVWKAGTVFRIKRVGRNGMDIWSGQSVDNLALVYEYQDFGSDVTPRPLLTRPGDDPRVLAVAPHLVPSDDPDAALLAILYDKGMTLRDNGADLLARLYRSLSISRADLERAIEAELQSE